MNIIEEFIAKESAGGIVLMAAAVLALILSNSPLAPWYQALLHLPLAIHIGEHQLSHSLYHWVNDGLMAIFFFLIGLEVKREVIEGQLSSLTRIALPGIAALGGMIVPAAIYLAFNAQHPQAINGWAIPTATDIAFALGILSLLGKRVPISLKIFLMALAIFDDLGAIIIIAIFYTDQLSTMALTIAGISLAGLVILNILGITRKALYVVIGIILWLSVLKSGIHATLAGVLLGFTIPLRGTDSHHRPISLLKEIEHQLHPWIAFLILPLFAFVNAGINFGSIVPEQMAESVPLGIMLGLFVGKQLGVFGFSWLAIRSGLAQLPETSNWQQLYGVSVLTGIGFTMSLFITSLAFENDALFNHTDKLAILVGSLLSGIVGYTLLRRSSP
ncbi:MAG: Na+/H+ antiporter NhaA [Mariprofundales bacterium]|nr:Na+/H+ antiporter NhaA [Mariprofundales bacterium]